MSSLKELVLQLEADLRARPPRHYIYADLPFALFCYPPQQEWQMRAEMLRLKTRLENAGLWKVTLISLAELLWQAIEESEGIQALMELERERGFHAAQAQVHQYLSDPDWRPLPNLLAERLAPLNPQTDLAFLWRAAALAPRLYRVSTLLDRMKGKTAVSCVLFMPATLSEGDGLRFMGITDAQPSGSYHTKVYFRQR